MRICREQCDFCTDVDCQTINNKIFTQQSNAVKDRQFYQVALNLTGNKDYFENKAFELIKKFGIFEAFKKSKNT